MTEISLLHKSLETCLRNHAIKPNSILPGCSELYPPGSVATSASCWLPAALLPHGPTLLSYSLEPSPSAPYQICTRLGGEGEHCDFSTKAGKESQKSRSCTSLGQGLSVRQIPGRQISRTEIQGRPLSMDQIPGRTMSMKEIPRRPLSMRELQGRPLSMKEIPGRPLSMREIPGRPLSMRELQGKPLSMKEIPGRPLSMRKIPGKPLSMRELQGRPLSMKEIPGRPLSEVWQSPKPPPYHSFLSLTSTQLRSV